MPTEIEALYAELDGRLEDRSFDLKRDLPAVGDMVKEIQAGMNGLEPVYRVLIGIDEGRDQRFDRENLCPVDWSNRTGACANADTYRTAIDSALKSNTSNFHDGFWAFEEVPVSGGSLIVIQIRRSPYRPHQHAQDGRYYIRRSGSTSHMTDIELREAWSGNRADRPDPDAPRSPLPEGELLRDLTDHRWIADADELRFAGGAQLHVRVLPLNPDAVRFSPTQLHHRVGGFTSLGPLHGGSHDRIEDGILAWRVEEANLERTGAITKIFENGEIWGVDNALVAAGSEGTANVPENLPAYIRLGLQKYGDILEKKLGIQSPYRVQITLHHVKNATLHTRTCHQKGKCFKEMIHFHAIWNRSSDLNADNLCNEFSKKLWDEFGLILSEDFLFGNPA